MALAKLLPRLRPLDQALSETRVDEPDRQNAGAKRKEGKGVECSELKSPSLLGGPYEPHQTLEYRQRPIYTTRTQRNPATPKWVDAAVL